jgi:ABC-type uncharacterized transport system ATPase component
VDVVANASQVTLRSVGDDAAFVLNMPQLVLHGGQLTYLMGHNGSGKSVFLRLLSGELESALGDVIGPEVSRHVSVVRQDATHSLALDLTVRENLLIRSPNMSLRNRLFPMLRLGRHIDELLKDHTELRNKVDDLALHLSGGQRQTLALLANIMHGTRLLLLDEFLAATDLRTGKALLRSVHEFVDFNRACAVIVSHDVSSALSDADRIIVLRQGALIGDISKDNVLWRHSSIAELITL